MILVCAVPTLFCGLLFHVLSVLPVFLAKRSTPGNEMNTKTEFALFLTDGMVLSAVALPMVLTHSAVMNWLVCALTMITNVINYSTMFGYAMRDESFDAP